MSVFGCCYFEGSRGILFDDQFFVKVAANVQEACALIEDGFEYVTREYNGGGKVFRKRK